MPSLLRAALALSLLSTAVVGNPTATRVDGPVAIQARAGGNVLLNPLGSVIKPLEYVLTNGQRMARGLPPNKPHFRRAGTFLTFGWAWVVLTAYKIAILPAHAHLALPEEVAIRVMASYV